MNSVTVRVDAGPDQRFDTSAFDSVIGTDTPTDWWIVNDEVVPGLGRAHIVDAEVSEDGSHAMLTLEPFSLDVPSEPT